MAILALRAIRAKLKAGLKQNPGVIMKILLILAIIVNSLLFLLGLFFIIVPFILPKDNRTPYFVSGGICVLMGAYNVMDIISYYPNPPTLL